MSYCPPWETNGPSTEQVEEYRPPWEDEPVSVPPDVLAAHKEKQARNGELINIDAAKAMGFARAYMIDFDHANAAALAFNIEDPEKARRKGLQYVQHPLVLATLQKLLDVLDESQLVTRKAVLFGLLREANYHGMGSSHAARTGAWGKLAKLIGMELPPEPEEQEGATTGVMVLPQSGTLEQWEAHASKTQKQLKHDVRN